MRFWNSNKDVEKKLVGIDRIEDVDEQTEIKLSPEALFKFLMKGDDEGYECLIFDLDSHGNLQDWKLVFFVWIM